MPNITWSDLVVCLYGAGGAVFFLVLATWLATRLNKKNKDKDKYED